MKKPKAKAVCLAQHMDQDTIDELIGPVCMIADLNRSRADSDLNLLIEAARTIRDREGFAVHTMKL